MPQSLEIEKVSATIKQLNHRIEERFPDADLVEVARNLHEISLRSAETSASITQPIVSLRVAVALLIVAGGTAFLYALTLIDIDTAAFSLGELVQVTEAAMNMTVLIGASVFFLITIENRIKRRGALNALHELRSIAHIIDMHQLTKDPATITDSSSPTASSPKRDMTPYELNRYLDYCSELLALTGKLSAIFGQAINDREVVGAANEIEQLTINLTREIWQKISTLQSNPT